MATYRLHLPSGKLRLKLLLLVGGAAATVLLAAGLWWFVIRDTTPAAPKPTIINSGPSAAKASTKEISSWTTATSQNNGFSMQVPDGWRLSTFPDERIGGSNLAYDPGTKAIIETTSNPYVSHLLRFNASIVTVSSNAKLSPQWESPQKGLTESTADFSIGSLKGKKFTGVFSGSLNQTIHHYLFDLGGDRQLSIVYTMDNTSQNIAELETVERAIKTIKIDPR